MLLRTAGAAGLAVHPADLQEPKDQSESSVCGTAGGRALRGAGASFASAIGHRLAIEPAGEVDEHIWLVAFMHYDRGYFDDEACRLEPIATPSGPRVLPMCSE
jgi:hypothetical protein